MKVLLLSLIAVGLIGGFQVATSKGSSAQISNNQIEKASTIETAVDENSQEKPQANSQHQKSM